MYTCIHSNSASAANVSPEINYLYTGKTDSYMIKVFIIWKYLTAVVCCFFVWFFFCFFFFWAEGGILLKWSQWHVVIESFVATITWGVIPILINKDVSQLVLQSCLPSYLWVHKATTKHRFNEARTHRNCTRANIQCRTCNSMWKWQMFVLKLSTKAPINNQNRLSCKCCGSLSYASNLKMYLVRQKFHLQNARTSETGTNSIPPPADLENISLLIGHCWLTTAACARQWLTWTELCVHSPPIIW